MKTVAVIPAYNESSHIRDVVERVLPYVDNIIVVDDGSKDSTYDVIEQLESQYSSVIGVQHEINQGKGAALKTGCEAAKLLHADLIIAMDADGQHNPAHIPDFINAITTQHVDIVFGTRKFNKQMPFTMLVGNHVLSQMIKKLFHVSIHDSQSGYRAFTVAAYDKLQWDSRGYEAETEMIVRASEHSLSYTEIDIDTIYLDSYKGTTAIDGIKILLQILRWKFI